MDPLLKVIPACCLRVFLSFFLFFLFLCFFVSFILSSCVYFSSSNIFYISSVLHSSLLYFQFLFLLYFLCRLSLFPDVFHLSLLYVFLFGCIPAYCLFLPVLHSSLLYFQFSFILCFLCRLSLFPGVFLFLSFIYSSLVVFLHTVFSILIIYSPLSSFIWRYVWYSNRPRHKNTCPPFLHMLWRSFTYLVLVLAT